MREIKIDKQEKLEGTVFRVSEFDRDSCVKELWCRLTRKNGDWHLWFFTYNRDALHDWKPLESLRSDLLPLAVKAIEYAQQWLERDDGES